MGQNPFSFLLCCTEISENGIISNVEVPCSISTYSWNENSLAVIASDSHMGGAGPELWSSLSKVFLPPPHFSFLKKSYIVHLPENVMETCGFDNWIIFLKVHVSQTTVLNR